MVIKNVNLVDCEKELFCDVLIKDDKILKIGKDLKDKEIIDAKGAYLLPSLIDLNVKLCDDKVSVGNFEKLSKKAIKGGVRTVVLNPDMNPQIDNEIILEFIKSQNKMIKNIEILPLIMAIKDENRLSEIAILLKKGAVAPFFYSDADSFLIARIFEYAKMYDVTLHCVARESSIREIGVMHEGEISSKLGLSGISEIDEISEVAKIIEFAKYYDVKVLFKSISASRSVELIKKAKNEGVKVFCEVSLHHFLKTDKECLGYNTSAKIDPPLKDENNQKQLLKYLKNKDIDILTSLHSPKSVVQKDISFDEAAYGVDSIGDYLKEIYENFVKKDILTLKDIVELTSKNPAKILNLKKGVIKEGEKADFILFDTKKCWV